MCVYSEWVSGWNTEHSPSTFWSELLRKGKKKRRRRVVWCDLWRLLFHCGLKRQTVFVPFTMVIISHSKWGWPTLADSLFFEIQAEQLNKRLSDRMADTPDPVAVCTVVYCILLLKSWPLFSFHFYSTVSFTRHIFCLLNKFHAALVFLVAECSSSENVIFFFCHPAFWEPFFFLAVYAGKCRTSVKQEDYKNLCLRLVYAETSCYISRCCLRRVISVSVPYARHRVHYAPPLEVFIRIWTGWRNRDFFFFHFLCFVCEYNHFLENMALHLFWINVSFFWTNDLFPFWKKFWGEL